MKSVKKGDNIEENGVFLHDTEYLILLCNSNKKHSSPDNYNCKIKADIINELVNFHKNGEFGDISDIADFRENTIHSNFLESIAEGIFNKYGYNPFEKCTENNNVIRLKKAYDNLSKKNMILTSFIKFSGHAECFEDYKNHPSRKKWGKR